jgi:hypothetical protein
MHDDPLASVWRSARKVGAVFPPFSAEEMGAARASVVGVPPAYGLYASCAAPASAEGRFHDGEPPPGFWAKRPGLVKLLGAAALLPRDELERRMTAQPLGRTA